MSSSAIYNLVRALSRPYIGAEVLYKGTSFKVWSAREVSVNLPNIECGKVLDASSKGILVKAYDNAILLTEHTLQSLPAKGEYML